MSVIALKTKRNRAPNDAQYYYTDDHKDLIRQMFKAKRSDEEMAVELSKTRPNTTVTNVKYLRGELGLSRRVQRKRRHKAVSPEKVLVPKEVTPVSKRLHDLLIKLPALMIEEHIESITVANDGRVNARQVSDFTFDV